MKLFSDLLQLILPIECIRCSVLGKILCDQCFGIVNSQVTAKSFSIVERERLFTIKSCLPYDQIAARIILGAKDRANENLENLVIEILKIARSHFPPNLVIVPIPSSSQARRERGRDFTYDLARAVARTTGDHVVASLKQVRRRKPQKSLTAQERLRNMAGALTFDINAPGITAVRSDMRSQAKFLLLDDVVTTGATMREGIRALQASGAHCIGGISAAFSPNWRATQPSH